MAKYAWTCAALLLALSCSDSGAGPVSSAQGGGGSGGSGSSGGTKSGESSSSAGEMTTGGASAEAGAGGATEAGEGGAPPVAGGEGGALLAGGEGGEASTPPGGSSGSSGGGGQSGSGGAAGPDACKPPVESGWACGNACGIQSEACDCTPKEMAGNASRIYPATGVPNFCPAPSGNASDVYQLSYAYSPGKRYCTKLTSPFGAWFRKSHVNDWDVTGCLLVEHLSGVDPEGDVSVYVKIKTATASWVYAQTATTTGGAACPLTCP